jgi:hypothetical protein
MWCGIGRDTTRGALLQTPYILFEPAQRSGRKGSGVIRGRLECIWYPGQKTTGLGLTVKKTTAYSNTLKIYI